MDTSDLELLFNKKEIKELSDKFPNYHQLRIDLKSIIKSIYERVRIDKTRKKLLSNEFFERLRDKDEDEDEFIVIKNTMSRRKGDKAAIHKIELVDNYKKTVWDEFV